jgi:hypothetical protein
VSRRDTPYAGVASLFRAAVASGGVPRVFEDGGQLLVFVHVRDVARANVLALTRPIPGAYNVASGTPRTILEMARALSRAVSADREPVVTGYWRPTMSATSSHPPMQRPSHWDSAPSRTSTCWLVAQDLLLGRLTAEPLVLAATYPVDGYVASVSRRLARAPPISLSVRR